MSLFKKWWFYLTLCMLVIPTYGMIGAIVSVTLAPSIYDAPYSVHDNDGRMILFKNYVIESERLVEVNGYYESQFPLLGWKYVGNKMWLIGDKLTGFGVRKR